MSFKRRAVLVVVACVVAIVPLAVFSCAALNPSEYNLVPDDIMNWTRHCDNGTLAIGAVNDSMVVLNNQGAVANVQGMVYSICYAAAIPSGFLVPNQSYSLSFTYPSDAEIIAATGRTQAQIDSNWSRVGVCYIGLAYFDNNGEIQLLENASVYFNASERAQYTGRLNYINFVCPDYSGKQLVFVVGFWRGGSTSTANTYLYFGRHYGLVDFERKQELENYNRIWYGNAEGDYSNPYTTESYDVGAAGDTDKIDNAVSNWEAGLGELGTPLRVSGVFLNSIFSTGGIALIGILVLVVLMFGVIFRLLGVT